MKDNLWLAVAASLLVGLSVQIYRDISGYSKAYTFDEFGHRCIVAIDGNASAMWCFELEEVQ